MKRAKPACSRRAEGERRTPEQRAVRVLDGGARLAAGVDDGLAVASPGSTPAPRSDRGWWSSTAAVCRRQHRRRILMIRRTARIPRGCCAGVAGVNTGPRSVTTKGALPWKAGYRLGTTGTNHFPSGPLSRAKGVGARLVARTERAGLRGAAWTRPRGCDALGRDARSVPTTTHRPVRGSRRSWRISGAGRSCAGGLVSVRTRAPPRFRLRSRLDPPSRRGQPGSGGSHDKNAAIPDTAKCGRWRWGGAGCPGDGGVRPPGTSRSAR